MPIGLNIMCERGGQNKSSLAQQLCTRDKIISVVFLTNDLRMRCALWHTGRIQTNGPDEVDVKVCSSAAFHPDKNRFELGFMDL